VNIPVNRILPAEIAPLESVGAQKPAVGDDSFGEVLERFVMEVDTLQHRAEDSRVKLASGEITDVHQVMQAVEEASLSMELMLEIRNKIVEAYQEVMRMQV
jgi:flagellar hook-basal body complex protein FliE